MRHTKVAQAPRQRGNNAESPKGGCTAGGYIIAFRHAQVAGQGFGIGNNGIHAARLLNSKYHHYYQRNGHKNGLNQIGERNRHKAAQHCITDDDNRANNHGGVVIHAKQAVEQCANGFKPGSRIGDKEYQNDGCRNAGKQVFFIAIPPGKIIRDSDSADVSRIAPQPPRHNKPVEVGAHRQTDAGPGNFRQAAQIGKTRQTHQQVTAHIAGLGAHGRYQRAHLASAQVKVIAAFSAAFFFFFYAHQHHGQQVQYNRNQNCQFGTFHFSVSPLDLPQIMNGVYHTK